MKKRRLLSLLSLTVFFASLVLFVFPLKSYAAVPTGGGGSDTYTFQDRANINANIGSVGQVTFTDSNVFDGNNNYTPQGGTLCDSNTGPFGIVVPHNTDFSKAIISAQLNAGIPSGSQGSCQDISQQIGIINPNAVANAKYEWNGNVIVTPPGQSSVAAFQPGQNSPQYYANDTSIGYYPWTCDKSAILVDSSNKGGTLFCFAKDIIAPRGGGTHYPAPPQSIANYAPPGFGVSQQFHTNIAGAQGSAAPGTGVNGTTDNTSAPSCETTTLGIGWLLCTVIKGLSAVADHIYADLIRPLLATKPIDLSNPGGDPTHTYSIWSTFRIYGDVFLVLILLVVVLGESIGGGLIDAYAAKKILPRLLVAAILINLSIYIVALAVDLTNVVGNGIEALIEAPFRAQLSHSNVYQIHINDATGTLGFTALVAGGIWVYNSIAYVIAALLIPAVLTLLLILVVALVRRGLILFLVLISPVAFVLYCLPNTEQYFRKWWDLMFRTLLIYPIIAAIFGIANALSVTINSTTTGISSTLAGFLSIVALFAPLFLIPFSFRIAGGLLSRFHDIATNARQRVHQGIVGDEKDIESFRGRAKLAKDTNLERRSLSGRALSTRIRPSTLFKPGERRENLTALREGRLSRLGQAYAEGDSVSQVNKGNDQFLLAASNMNLANVRRNQTIAKRDQALADGDATGVDRYNTQIASWDQAIAAARSTPYSQATRLQNAQALASTGFQFSAGQEGYNELAQTLGDITGADLQYQQNADGSYSTDRNGQRNVIGASGSNAGRYANAMNFSQFSARQGGRFDLGGINNGSGYNYEAGMDKASGYTAGQGKPKIYTAGAAHYLGVPLQGDEGDSTPAADQITRHVFEGLNSGEIKAENVRQWYGKLLDAQQNATGANRKEIDKQIVAIETGVRPYGTSPAPEGPMNELSQLAEQLGSVRRARRGGLDPNLRDNP